MHRAIPTILIVMAGVASGGAGVLEDRITTTALILPHPLEPNQSSFCTWTSCSLGPRLYLATRADGTLLAGWTDSTDDGHVSVITGSSITATHDFPGLWMRGLVAHADGSFGVLLWDDASEVLWVSKRNPDGSAVWTTNINSTVALAREWVGDKRLAYGGGRYAAYFGVNGVAGQYAGHWGDQLALVSDAGAVQSGGWSWGCSHSMAELIDYHPGAAAFTAFCASDCYPGKGLYRNHDAERVFAGDGDCGGMTSVQLGQMAPADAGWKVVFNALDTASTVAHGVGLASVGSGDTSVTWLTATDGSQERDPVVARIGSSAPERYLVGWRHVSSGSYVVGVVDGTGSFVEGPETLASGVIRWGARDDSFRSAPNGTVVWLEGSAGASMLELHRYEEVPGLLFRDGFESGSQSEWSSWVP